MIKSILKLLIPPIIFLLINKFKNKYFGYLFWGQYSNPQDVENTKKDSKYLTETQHIESLNNFLEEDKKNINFNLRSSILPIFLSDKDNNNFNILDVGGGFNSCYKYIKFSIKKKIKVTVLEKSEIVDALKKYHKINDDVLYLKKLPLNLKQFDILYYGSSFQYFLHLKDFYNNILGIKPDYIIITESAFTNNEEDIFSFQVNMYPSKIPYKINSFSRIKKEFENIGYNIIYNARRNLRKHRHVSEDKIFIADLIFKKI